MASTVQIIFHEVPNVNERIEIREALFGSILNEIFKVQRLASAQVTLPTDNGGGVYAGFVSAYYRSAFNADYNAGSSFFNVTVTFGATGSGLGTVNIEARYPNMEFEVLINTTTATININNESETDFAIDSLTFGQASVNPCANISVSIETTDLATKILQPFIDNSNTDNPIVFDWPRGMTFTLELENADNYFISEQITTPDLLNAANFSMTINNSPFGATVLILNNGAVQGLELEYSLDGISWFEENVFSGLLDDQYTLHVRDQYGCSFTQPFAITDTALYVPVAYVSKTNAIQFAERVTFGDSINYKKDENTLSCEVDDEVKFQEIQLWQTSDVVPTQFKSNYATLSAKVIKPDLSEDVVTIVKKSNFIGLKDKRDAFKYNLGNGKTGIYFLSGDIYDYNTNVVIEPYALNGFLPNWGVAGNYVSIGSAFFLIEEIIFDEARNAKVLVIQNIYTGNDAAIVVGSIYNLQNYEVYEFEVDMLDYLGMDIRVKIEMTDPNFQAKSWLSEIGRVAVRHQNTVEIRYFNTSNTDIYYTSGIEFKIRQLLIDKAGYFKDESEINPTDTNVVLVDAKVYEGDEFRFEPETKQIAQKLVRALSHQYVFMDEVGYVKDGEMDSEKQNLSNAYVCTQRMLKSGNSYTSQSFSIGNALYDGVPAQIPGLVNYNDGFVRYQP